jgi:hypothetical protein
VSVANVEFLHLSIKVNALVESAEFRLALRVVRLNK